MASQNHQLHFLLIPLMSPSHIIPLTDFAKLLAHRGPKVTIITTPLNAPRCKAAIDRATNARSLDIHLVVIPFPCGEAGLPEGCENMDSLTSADLLKQFFVANEMLLEPLEKLVAEQLEPKPSCIIATNALHWTNELARQFGIPRYVFQTVSCFTLTCFRINSSNNVADSVASDSDPFTPPDVPHRVEFNQAQLPGTMRKNSNELKGLIGLMKEAEKTAQGVLANSFEELETRYVEEYKKDVKNLWCIGPVSLCNKEMSDKLDRGNSTSIDVQDCLKWLDSMNPSSVIYVCFGSLCHVSSPQLIEIGLGLEASNRPFIWIIRKGDYSAEVKTWLQEENIEARIQGRGLIIQGWAPQVLILSHPAIGGFLTHCGWNSTLEGVCAGVPMITWPMFAEQFHNEKFIVHVLRVGVRIGVEVCMKWDDQEEKNNVLLVKREQVQKAIDHLMDEGKEGKERRHRAKELAEMGKTALEKGGSSYLNITSLIQDVIQAVSQNEINSWK